MATKSQKGRKIGRNRERPAQKVYTQAKRWVTNKAKAMRRHTRRMAKKAIHRLEWVCRIQRRQPTGEEAQQLMRLRHIVSQNLTG